MSLLHRVFSRLAAASMVVAFVVTQTCADKFKLHIDSPQTPPAWALMERELIESMSEACFMFYDKYFDERGYVFFTNYSSNKAIQIDANEHVSLLFFWPTLGRQVGIRGTASRIPTKAARRGPPPTQPSAVRPMITKGQGSCATPM